MMAPTLAVGDVRVIKQKVVWVEQHHEEVEEMRRRNEELEKELKELKAREEDGRRQLDRAKERVRVAEEAEERLAAELGDLEAEAFTHARECRLQIKVLCEQLAKAYSNGVGSDGATSPSPSTHC